MLISVDVDDVCTRPWVYAVEPFKITPTVSFVGNSWVSIYLIDTHKGLILIDAGMPQMVYLTLENIRKLGYDPHEIKYILLSHAHYDHCGGAKILAEYTGAKIFMGKEDMCFLDERKDLIHVTKNWFNDFKVDKYYEEGKPIVLGDTKIEVKHCPGHTPGTYSFFFMTEWEGKKYRCGMHGGLGINSLTDEYLDEYNLPYSLRDDFENNLMKMREEPVDIALGSHTNHGDMLGKARRLISGERPNPFIDKSEFRRVIDQRYDTFIELCHRKERKF